MTLYLYVPSKGDVFYSPVLDKALKDLDDRIFSIGEESIQELNDAGGWTPCEFNVSLKWIPCKSGNSSKYVRDN